MLTETDYKGFRIEVHAERADGAWNADVRIGRILSEMRPYVHIVTPAWLHPWIRVQLAVRVVALLVITVAAGAAASCSTMKASDLAVGPSRCNGMAAAGGLCDSAGGGGGGGGSGGM